MKHYEPWDIVIKDRFLSREKRDNPYVVAFMYFLVFFLSLLLVIVVFFQLCLIDGSSMENSLYNNDHVMLSKTSFSTNYKHDDIVVITKGENNNQYNIIKRVIGLEGDTLQFKTINGKIKLLRKDAAGGDFYEVDENYIKEDMKVTNSWENNKPDSAPFTISEGMVYVLGDNRNNSLDSRKDGSYSLDMIYGKMLFKVDKNSLIEKLLMILYNDKKPITRDDNI